MVCKHHELCFAAPAPAPRKKMKQMRGWSINLNIDQHAAGDDETQNALLKAPGFSGVKYVFREKMTTIFTVISSSGI